MSGFLDDLSDMTSGCQEFSGRLCQLFSSKGISCCSGRGGGGFLLFCRSSGMQPMSVRFIFKLPSKWRNCLEDLLTNTWPYVKQTFFFKGTVLKILKYIFFVFKKMTLQF